MEWFLNFISPPVSPSRQTDSANIDDPGDLLVAGIVAEAEAEQSINNNQNYVELIPGFLFYFDSILGCKASTTGELTLYMEWAQTPENIDLILNETTVPIEKLCHNDDAIRWKERFENWVDQIRYQLPFDTLLYWSDMESIFTVNATLSSWLDSRGYCHLQAMLEKHGCISIDMLLFLDEETLLKWGMRPLPARLLMVDIRQLKT